MDEMRWVMAEWMAEQMNGLSGLIIRVGCNAWLKKNKLMGEGDAIIQLISFRVRISKQWMKRDGREMGERMNGQLIGQHTTHALYELSTNHEMIVLASVIEVVFSNYV